MCARWRSPISISLPCDNQKDINRMLNGHLSDDGLRQLSKSLKQCHAGDRFDLDIYNDGTIEAGPKGIGKLRIIGRF